MVLACAFAGIGTAGWYGVFLAEIARQAPSERVGIATGGALFFVYAAICVGPLVFTATVSIAGGYPAAFWLRSRGVAHRDRQPAAHPGDDRSLTTARRLTPALESSTLLRRDHRTAPSDPTVQKTRLTIEMRIARKSIVMMAAGR